jgi:hypothetical protein
MECPELVDRFERASAGGAHPLSRHDARALCALLGAPQGKRFEGVERIFALTSDLTAAAKEQLLEAGVVRALCTFLGGSLPLPSLPSLPPPSSRGPTCLA